MLSYTWTFLFDRTKRKRKHLLNAFTLYIHYSFSVVGEWSCWILKSDFIKKGINYLVWAVYRANNKLLRLCVSIYTFYLLHDNEGSNWKLENSLFPYWILQVHIHFLNALLKCSWHMLYLGIVIIWHFLCLYVMWGNVFQC